MPEEDRQKNLPNPRSMIRWIEGHRNSIRFAAVSVVLFGVFYLLRRLFPTTSLLPGTTYSVALLVFWIAVPLRTRIWVLFTAIPLLSLLSALTHHLSPSIAQSGPFLLGIQVLSFSVWSYCLFAAVGWNRESHSTWTVAGLLELLLVPSLTSGHELIGFGVLVFLTIWVIGERPPPEGGGKEEDAKAP